jgi:hypothetical protein
MPFTKRATGYLMFIFLVGVMALALCHGLPAINRRLVAEGVECVKRAMRPDTSCPSRAMIGWQP